MLKAPLSPHGSPCAVLNFSAKFLSPTRLIVSLAGAVLLMASSQMMAADIETTLIPGLSTTKSTSVTLPAQSPNADVLFSFDLTGSMFDALDTAKKNALNLMSALQATGVNYRYGVASFMDYPNVYGSCGYSNFDYYTGEPLPYGDPLDYPYLLSQGMTTNTAAVSHAINSLALGFGSDGPEAYTRALYESYADTNVMWRTGAKRVVINFGDAVPHDCNLNVGIPDAYPFLATTGGDPGRDGVLGTFDDLDLQQVLAGMASNHVVLLAARLSSFSEDFYFRYWTNWTAKTGGKAFLTQGGTLIRDLMFEITNSVAITCVSNLHVTVDPPAFNSWLAVVPSAYDRVWPGDVRDFSVVIKPPVGTPASDYSFTLHVVDDQAVEYQTRSVVVHVLAQVPLPMALNNSNFVWTTDRSLPWFGQLKVSHDGVASARSFAIGDGEQTSLTTTTNGPGTLSFWWKVSSQTNADMLSFVSYGSGVTNLAAQISGEANWTQVSMLLPGGPQTLLWTYSKDAAQSAGLDASFVDQFSYTAGPTLPYIITNPLSQVTVAGSPTTFSVLANGTPALMYQWRLNGRDIPGATSNNFTLAAPLRDDAGSYSVRVFNAYGTTNSANASLTVIPLIQRGDNTLGQTKPLLLPVSPVAIAAGSYHTLALLGDGTVLAWGQNYEGQCDPPKGLANVAQIAAGGYHSLALRADGTVAAWGANDYHQSTPPAGLANVLAVAGGFWHSLALRADGTVVAWGDNSYGQTAVPFGLNNVVAIAAGGNHSLALRANGTVVGWGDNTDANGNFVGQSTVPWNLNGVQAIGAGEYHSLAARTNGTVVAWGDNAQGQCQPPANLTNAVAVVGGGTHSIALKADSTVVAWGNNWDGQCNYPTNLSNIAAVAAGEVHSLFLIGVPPPKLLRTSRAGNQFSLFVATLPGKNYALEYKTALQASTWTALATARGQGGLQVLTDTAAAGAPRFYRVRVW